MESKYLLITLVLLSFSSYSVFSYKLNGKAKDPITRANLHNEETADSSDFILNLHNQHLDHFTTHKTKQFKQRYWVNDQYWDKDEGPIILYICGEWTCSGAVPGAAQEYGIEQKANFIVLEHRYYGDSQPFNDQEGGWSYENLKWLNTTQALADIAHFIDYQNANYEKEHQWVIVGGSYPGALVAWFKHVYPNHVSAAWSSSGVINAIENFIEFDMDIGIATGKSGQACPEQIRLITQSIDDVFQHGSAEDKKNLFEKFNNENQNVEYLDFMFFIADIFTLGVQYGGRTDLCDTITAPDFQSDTWGNLGIYAQKKGTFIDDYDASDLRNITIDTSKAGRQWTYQYCTEFGWFQAPFDPYPTRSYALKAEYWLDYCKRVFEDSIPPPAIEYAHSYYGDLEITGEHIYFLNACEDPWQYAGMQYIRNETSQNEMKATLIECENCGHCVDLHGSLSTDDPNLTAARNDVKQTITMWLKKEKECQSINDNVSDDWCVFNCFDGAGQVANACTSNSIYAVCKCP